MQFKIVLDNNDLKYFTTKHFERALKRYNTNEIETFVKNRCGVIELVIIKRRNVLKEICQSLNIPYFNTKEEYNEWARKNGRAEID